MIAIAYREFSQMVFRINTCNSQLLPVCWHKFANVLA